jgi:EAL domain-containing protein (putative c-di-GMP-specific phosphodiesterase class I)
MGGARFRRRKPIDGSSDSPLSAAVTERDRDVIQLVEDAVKRRNVLLAFQPVVQSARPERPAFYEALVRIIDPTGRIIPAREFFPTVETRELGREIDCLSLGKGFDALSRDPSLRLSVNMSARSIGYPRFVRTLQQGLRNCPTAGERMILEITESSAMMMPELVTTFMAGLQSDGVSFALDNFGSGNTSFRALREFYFDMIKIDGGFIRGIAQSPDNQVLTQAMLAVARQFDMFAVAESVESQGDADYLAAIGMDCMQGYFFGAPTVTPPWKMPDAKRSA